MPINKCITVIIILPNNIVKIIMLMSNYTNMQYENKCFFSRHLKLVRLSQLLMTVGKLFRSDAAATANEQSPALARVHFTLTYYCCQPRHKLLNCDIAYDKAVLVGYEEISTLYSCSTCKRKINFPPPYTLHTLYRRLV